VITINQHLCDVESRVSRILGALHRYNKAGCSDMNKTYLLTDLIEVMEEEGSLLVVRAQQLARYYLR
jgi:hypothetical protein